MVLRKIEERSELQRVAPVKLKNFGGKNGMFCNIYDLFEKLRHA